MAGLTILITNVTLGSRSGTEVYVRDLARGLARRGHRPMVFTPKLGPIAEELRREGIPVVDDLASLPEAPQVVHGQHHGPTMAALLHYPHSRGIFVVHDRRSPHDEPPALPRLRRYVAVDHACRERLDRWPEQTQVMFNAVDLARFVPRSPLPERPRRAILFASASAGPRHCAPVAAVCREQGIELDVIGLSQEVAAPEEVLGRYDLVFAKARCALEAMAVGAAVILASSEGVGPLVSPSNFDDLRRMNFGFRTLTEPLTAAALAAQIARYDATAALQVSGRVRAEAGLDALVDTYVALYREVLAEPLGAGVEEDGRQAARYVLERLAVTEGLMNRVWQLENAPALVESAPAPVESAPGWGLHRLRAWMTGLPVVGPLVARLGRWARKRLGLR